MRAVEIVRALCPRANARYVEAFERADGEIAAAGITTPLRMAHFMAQVCHETGGLTILVENLHYTTAGRLKEVWPTRYPGTKAYLRDPVGLGICVYGGRMGNRPAPADDGYRYRGRGPMQMTGLDAYRRYGARLGVDFVGNPDLATDARYLLAPALAEWTDGNCNEKADRNAIVEITQKINGGKNGLKDRIAWFDRIWKLIGEGVSWEAAGPDPEIATLQSNLVAAGFPLVVDGRKGPETVKAIRAFQASAGVPVTGIADQVTRAALSQRLAAEAEPRPEKPASADPPTLLQAQAKKLGAGFTVGGGTADQVLNQAQQVSAFATYVPILKYAAAALIVLGVGLVLYGLASDWLRKRRADQRGAPA
ncbi:MAG TPA: peptidoglycan-binding protein [Pirellulaceae bacterium]|nr:peptidoglycan-binding protein [Pirellulaceae bacterium]